MSFSANGTTRGPISGVQVRITRPEGNSNSNSDSNKAKASEVWGKAKAYAHDRLWFGYVLPGLLQSCDVDTRGMDVSSMIKEIGEQWDNKQYETNPQISVVMSFTHEDALLEGFDGEVPTRYDKETGQRVPVNINALATIGSNDFRWWVMTDDDDHDAVVPNNVFFATYPVKYRGEVQKGQFRCILKTKK